MDKLLQQIKKRRLELGVKQKDMLLKIGISRQQYQHIESKGNPSLSTLELIALGLKGKLMLIPNEKITAVMAILEDQDQSSLDDPWENILGDTDD